MKYFIILSLLINNLAFATQRVAIVDTGLDLDDPRFTSVLCKEGHQDFTGEGIEDINGHGTHIAGVVKTFAGNSDYCLIILKFYKSSHTPEQNLSTELQAFTRASELGVTIINYSAGGSYTFNQNLEKALIGRLKNITFVVAAGNQYQDLDTDCNFFPACYNFPNVIMVGNNSHEGKPTKSSNYGKRIKVWEIGESILSTWPCKFTNVIGCQMYMSGTSQAAATHTGKLIKQRDNDAKIH